MPNPINLEIFDERDVRLDLNFRKIEFNQDDKCTEKTLVIIIVLV